MAEHFNKKILILLFIVCAVILMTACASNQSASTNLLELSPADILDTKMGEKYSLGMEKEIFDEAFPDDIEKKGYGRFAYLDGLLVVQYEDDKAVDFTVYVKRNRPTRFEFYNFDFSEEAVEEAKKTYKRTQSEDGDCSFYHQNYDKDGKKTDTIYTEVEAALCVADRYISSFPYNINKGDVMFYSIGYGLGHKLDSSLSK